MNRRQSLLASAALIVGGLAIGSSFARPTAGQPPASSAPGRYAVAAFGGATSGFVLVTDTTTGQTWKRYASGGPRTVWESLGTPVEPR